jgi:hypothetical protein
VNARSFSDEGAWIANFRIISWSGVSSWGLYTSVRWLAKRLGFSVSHLAQGLGGYVFGRIGGCKDRGFFLDLIGFQMIWSSRLREAMYAVEVSLFSSLSAPLSLLFALLK